MDIKNLGKGCFPDKKDKKDFVIEEILGLSKPFDWSKGFDIEERVGKLKVENQSRSSSCVGQAWSKYLEVLEIIENSFTDLSAKDIYSRIFMPQGGASLRDGAKLAVNRGVATERSNPSYPATEMFMREIVSELEEEAKKFQSKSYATTTHNNIDFFASYIRDFNGVVGGAIGDNAGWNVDRSGIVRPPKDLDWGHAIFFGKAKMMNGEKYLGFLNSWGEEWGDNGWGWLGQDYFGTVNYKNVLFNIWTLIDNKNNNKIMLKTVRALGEIDIYVIVGNNKHLIPDSDTQHYYLGTLGILNPVIEITKEELDGYTEGERIPSIKLMRVLEPVVEDIFLKNKDK